MTTRIRKDVDVSLNLFVKGGDKLNKQIRTLNEGVIKSKKGFDVLTNTAKNYSRSTESIQRLSRDFNLQLTKQGKSLRTTEGNLLKNTQALNSYIGENAGFGKVMKMNVRDLGDFNKQGGRFTSMGGRMANRIRKMTHGMKGFKMEMLGVMFFGMAITRTFGGLLSTSMEWMGVMDIVGVALGMLFLPAAEKLLIWAIEFMDWVGNLSEEQKEWYNKIILVVIGIGLLLAVIGTLALGIGSLIIAFGALFSPMGLIIGALATLGGYTFLSGMFKNISGTADELGKKLVPLGISANLITTLKDKFKSALSKMKEFFITFKTKIGTWIAESIPMFLGGAGKFVSSLVKGIVDNAQKITGAVGSLLDRFFSFLSENGPKILDAGKKILTKIIKGIGDNADKLESAVIKILKTLGELITENSESILAIGAAIAKGIVKGIKNWFTSNPAMIIGAIIGGIVGAIGGPLGVAVGATLGGALGAKVGKNIQKNIDLTTSKRLQESYGFPNFENGGTIPDVGTSFRQSKAKEQPQTINVTNNNNVTVSDKRTFERMLKENNDKAVADMRRLFNLP